MKSITNILKRSNITPYERVMTLVHNDIHKEKTGKDALSDSDIHTLTKGWYGNTSEINEYNKYMLLREILYQTLYTLIKTNTEQSTCMYIKVININETTALFNVISGLYLDI